MRISEKLMARAAESKTGRFIDTIRTGWNSYSFIFYIGGISAILGSLFGIAGWLSIVVTIAFFYSAGRFRQRLDREKERRRRIKERTGRKL